MQAKDSRKRERTREKEPKTTREDETMALWTVVVHSLPETDRQTDRQPDRKKERVRKRNGAAWTRNRMIYSRKRLRRAFCCCCCGGGFFVFFSSFFFFFARALLELSRRRGLRWRTETKKRKKKKQKTKNFLTSSYNNPTIHPV